MLQAVSELHRLLALLFTSNAMSSWNLGRSASSVGERHSVTFSLPLLPKRAETFGGFDHAAAAAAAAAAAGAGAGAAAAAPTTGASAQNGTLLPVAFLGG